TPRKTTRKPTLRKSRRSNQKATIRSLFVFAFFVLKGRFILPFSCAVLHVRYCFVGFALN
ncbi:MAG: hypothetical protein EBX17_10600, partial [Betaproteobacteria bacterium]|nr:hypothetical protein [Betaproteobacteria bacterium]